MEKERRAHILSDQEIDDIADAVLEKANRTFRLDEEHHYNSHKRLDKVLAGLSAAKGIGVSVKWYKH